MIVHEIKNKFLRDFYNLIYFFLKTNSYFEELPKFIMQYLVIAWDIHAYFLEDLRSRAIIKVNRKKLAEYYNYFNLIFRTSVILSSVLKKCSNAKNFHLMVRKIKWIAHAFKQTECNGLNRFQRGKYLVACVLNQRAT